MMMWPDLGKCIENMKLIDKVTETKYLPYPSRSRRIKNKRETKEGSKNMELKEKTLYINTIKRCKRLGAISEKEIIIQLAKEIEYYRNEISNLENELGKQFIL